MSLIAAPALGNSASTLEEVAGGGNSCTSQQYPGPFVDDLTSIIIQNKKLRLKYKSNTYQ